MLAEKPKSKVERSKTAGAPKRGPKPASKGRPAKKESRRQKARTTKSTERGVVVKKSTPARSVKPKKLNGKRKLTKDLQQGQTQADIGASTERLMPNSKLKPGYVRRQKSQLRRVA